ncbi:MAG: hypothetical protein AAB922_01365 [Patescibacteria group bacterium]
MAHIVLVWTFPIGGYDTPRHPFVLTSSLVGASCTISKNEN